VNPSPQAIALIRSRVTNWNQPNDVIVDALNAPSIQNTNVQKMTQKKLTIPETLGKLSKASKTRLLSVPSVEDIRKAVNAQDRSTYSDLIDFLNAGGGITDQEKTDVTAILTATEPDPSWQSQISWAQANLGRPADLGDIVAARP
jgi:hypothetical protein